jgi:hypothetical protein
MDKFKIKMIVRMRLGMPDLHIARLQFRWLDGRYITLSNFSAYTEEEARGKAEAAINALNAN